MIIDGKRIAEEIFQDLRAKVRSLPHSPRLTVATCAPNFETARFLGIKKKRAEDIGISLCVLELPEDASTNECVTSIKRAATDSDGVIVQLPFPSHIDSSALVQAIPKSHDVDAFGLVDPEVLPPVVGAMKEILDRSGIDVGGKQVLVVGNGRLVGTPAAAWLKNQGAKVEVVTIDSGNITEKTKEADIIVLGAGSPHLLTLDMVNEGVVILDAGTSEEEGYLKGDADPECASKASLFTPVPGGIGPITIAVLLRNLVVLTSRK